MFEDYLLKKLQRERYFLSRPRIRGLRNQYSAGWIMRNPYRQAVWGTSAQMSTANSKRDGLVAQMQTQAVFSHL